ncbi:GlxA family transcriptional regulator [Microbulbifer sp. S227A]|uniref:GlxA family transcriptional regulator n=1 Tax=Microbulbifer sp. S227A TaxID=3415131 RepID=UPI003C7D3FD8
MKSAINILEPTSRPLDVAVLVLDDSNTLSFAAGVDPMRAANRMSGRRLFDWQYVTATGSPAQLTSGLSVPGPALSRLQGCDLLLVVAGFNLKRHDTPALRAGLRRIAASGATLAGIDGGPWLMAEAGVLDQFSATTHWEDLDKFSQNFPEITPLRNRFHVDRTRMTSGGATPAIDMMLYLIKCRYGAALSARVAGAFIYDSAPDPARAQSRSGNPGHSALTARVSALMEQTLDAPLAIPELARRAGTSPRMLQSQFRIRLNTTPKAHYLSLRLAEAMRLVRDTDMPLLDVALATGFGSAATFARAFQATHGCSARAIRRAEQSAP